MKRSLRSVGLLMLVLASSCRTVPTAEYPCAKVVTTVDDFGKTTRGQMFLSFGGGSGVGLGVENGRPVLRAIFMMSAASQASVPKGALAKVALGDGTFLDLKSAKESPGLRGGNQYGLWTRWVVDFALSDAQLNMMKKASFRALKSEVAGMEAIVKDDDATAGMQFVAQCLGPDVTPLTDASPGNPFEL